MSELIQMDFEWSLVMSELIQMMDFEWSLIMSELIQMMDFE